MKIRRKDKIVEKTVPFQRANFIFRFPYSALSKMAWGDRAGKVINVLLNILVFGSNIPPLVIGESRIHFYSKKPLYHYIFFSEI